MVCRLWCHFISLHRPTKHPANNTALKAQNNTIFLFFELICSRSAVIKTSYANVRYKTRLNKVQKVSIQLSLHHATRKMSLKCKQDTKYIHRDCFSGGAAHLLKGLCFYPRFLDSAYHSALSQDTEPQVDPNGCSIIVWKCVYDFLMSRLALCRVATCHYCVNGWMLTCVAKALWVVERLEKDYINTVHLPFTWC